MPKPTFFNLPDDKRETILAIAIDEFAEQGYNAASISRMVAAAGIAKGSFYQYFTDKADLFQHVMQQGGEAKTRFLENLPEADLPLFDYLRWLLKQNVNFDVTHPKLARIAYRAVKGDAPGDLAFIQQMNAASRAFFSRLIQQGVDDGHLDANLNVDAAAFVFTAVSMQLSDYLVESAGVEPEDLVKGTQGTPAGQRIEAAFDDVLRILEFGMAARE